MVPLSCLCACGTVGCGLGTLCTLRWRQGERLSHAVGCAFAICLEKKQKRDKETGVTVTYSQDRTSFTRTGSFRQTTLTERIVDPQSAIVAGQLVIWCYFFTSSFNFSFSPRWHCSAWKGPYTLHPVSQQSPQGCSQNCVSICVVGHRLFLTLKGVMSAASFLHSSFLQVISAVMLWPVHVQKASISRVFG